MEGLGAPTTDVFISFVHEDQTVAEATRNLVTQELGLGSRVFLSSDKGRIYAGDDWLREITKALRRAKVVILMMSKRSVRRPWVNFEAGGAWMNDRVVIPCCYGNQSKGALPQPYSSLHAVNLHEDTDDLIASVHHHLGLLTPLPTPRAIKLALDDIAPAPKNAWQELLDPYKQRQTALDRFKDEDGP
jgi:hypothetical protein